MRSNRGEKTVDRVDQLKNSEGTIKKQKKKIEKKKKPSMLPDIPEE